MYIGRQYKLREVLHWTRRELLVFACLGALPPVATMVGFELGTLPWAPLAVLGTAVAFVTGLKSNAAYGRLWEARQIWGVLVNESRAWCLLVRAFLVDEDGSTRTRLVLRQVAFLTALRHELRQPRPWEASHSRSNREYRERTYVVPEHVRALSEDLSGLIDPQEVARVLEHPNHALAVLSLQAADLKRLRDAERIEEFRYLTLLTAIAKLLDQLGKCERIKNFPYPRQFASLNRMFIWLFVALLPFGLAGELAAAGPGLVWLTPPLTMVVAWVFHTMEKIGESSENPFEGSPNDVPISTMSRSIEIDLRALLGECPLPEPLAPQGNVLM